MIELVKLVLLFGFEIQYNDLFSKPSATMNSLFEQESNDSFAISILGSIVNHSLKMLIVHIQKHYLCSLVYCILLQMF